ncbi:MAG TPA: hypothetical protein PKE12_07155 [Kiritimatiellia bacterium]|nr:hypothetical protein [Kiritimatiellia bacterium]
MAQTDLFGWLATENPAAQPVAASRPAAAAQPRSRAEALAKPAPAASVRKLRSVAPAGYAQRRRTVNSVEVVRLLQVTRGVNGVEAPPAIELPRSRFSAAVDLWKGRPVGTPFVMATSGQRAARNK